MNKNEVLIKIKFLANASSQKIEYATPFSAGLDLRAAIPNHKLTIAPGQRQKIPTGLAIEICEPNIAGFIFSRSGLGTKKGLVVTQGVGVIDPDYRGEIFVSLYNISNETQTIAQNERIAQLIFLPFFTAKLQPCTHLSSTQRGAGGFGHTGKF